MKKITVLLVLALSMMQAGAKSVVLTLADGSLVYYLLGGETNPVMRFVDGTVVVNADVYEISGIKNFYISETDDPTVIPSAKTGKGMSFAGNTFIVKGKASQVKVFALNGMEVEANITDGNDNAYVDMGSLQKGTYVIQVGTASFKVMKK